LRNNYKHDKDIAAVFMAMTTIMTGVCGVNEVRTSGCQCFRM